jgi:hypothetical protein
MSPRHGTGMFGFGTPAERPGMDINSGVSASTGDGFVSLHWGEQSGQLTIDEARAHALSILGAAEAADTDAALFRWCKANGMSDEQAAAMLDAIRRTRA